MTQRMIGTMAINVFTHAAIEDEIGQMEFTIPGTPQLFVDAYIALLIY